MDLLHTTEVMTIFVKFVCLFGQNLVAMATFLRSLQSGMSSLDWPITKRHFYVLISGGVKPPDISNHILVISRRHAFITILSQNWLVTMVTRLCLLCMGVSQMNSLISDISEPNSALWYVTYNWRYGRFVKFFAYFGQNLVLWQRPLHPCNQKYLLLICRPSNQTVIGLQACLSPFFRYIWRYTYFPVGAMVKINSTSGLKYSRNPPKTIGDHITGDTTMMASLAMSGGRLRPVERSTRFVWLTDTHTNWLYNLSNAANALGR